ncbi:MAG: ribbon-helix-helix protein, CopG family [Candidatus Lokiarchaeota archaeon]|nr:ribbon-helix-helix protein, CopG family [Candidatus Lokiarchaeota archaeon]
MYVTVSFTLSDDEVVELDEIATKEKIDRSELIRKFLL